MLCKLEGKQKWTMHKDDSTRGGVKCCLWHIKLGYQMQNLSRMCRNPQAQHLGLKMLEWILVPTVICYNLDHDTSSTVTYCTPWWPNHCCIEIETTRGIQLLSLLCSLHKRMARSCSRYSENKTQLYDALQIGRQWKGSTFKDNCTRWVVTLEYKARMLNAKSVQKGQRSTSPRFRVHGSVIWFLLHFAMI